MPKNIDQGRVQVDDPLERLPQRQVLPVAREVFVGGPAPGNAGYDLRDISSALSGFSDTLGKTGAVQAAVDRENQKRGAAEFAALPREQQINYGRQKLDNGNTFSGELLTSKMYGDAEGEKFVNELHTRAPNEIDLTDDVDGWVTHSADPIRKRLGTNRAALEGFDSRVLHFRQGLRDQKQKYLEQAVDEQKKETIYRSFAVTIEEGLSKGQTPEQIIEGLNQARSFLAENNSAHPQVMDEEMMKAADRLGTKYPDLAVKILTEPRKGLNGENLGPLGTKRKNVDKTIEILGKLEKQRAEEETQSIKSKLAEFDLKAALAGAPMNMLEKFEWKGLDGKPRHLSTDERKALLSSAYERYSDGKARDERPSETMAREIKESASFGIENPRWKKAFTGFLQRLTPESISDPQQVQQILSSAQLYKEMRVRGKFLAERHMDKPTEEFLDKYWIAREHLATSDDVALRMAFDATNNLSKEKIDTLRGHYEDIDRDARKLAGNGSQYSGEIRRLARSYAELGGLDAKTAISLAETKLKGSGVVFDNFWTPLPRDAQTGQAKYAPEDFSELGTRLLHRWFHARGNHNEYRESDLTLRSVDGGNTYRVVNKGTGMPVMGVNVQEGEVASPTFTVTDFEGERAAKRDENLESIVRQNESNKAFYDGHLETAIRKAMDKHSHPYANIARALGLVTEHAIMKAVAPAGAAPSKHYDWMTAVSEESPGKKALNNVGKAISEKVWPNVPTLSWRRMGKKQQPVEKAGEEENK